MSVKVATYLDSNAGAPLKLAVLEALRSYLDSPGSISNPSSIHSHGRRAKRIVAEARESVAFSFGPKTDPEQVIFTSSGSEANQLAIRSGLLKMLERAEASSRSSGEKVKVLWITSPVEHDSVRQMVAWAQSKGVSVHFLEVDHAGVPDPENLDSILSSANGSSRNPCQGLLGMLSLLWVNNETGAVTDLERFSQWASNRGFLFHVDAAQAWGKIPMDVSQLGAHYVSVSGHKIGALPGTGALWIDRGVSVQSTIFGKQEKGRRGGTENLIGILSLGAAAKDLNPVAWDEQVRPIRDRLENAIYARIDGTRINSRSAKRVANTINLSFEGVEGDGLVMALDLAGYSVSSGSACSSGVLEPSHVLMAMGRTPKQAMAAVRVSLPVTWPVAWTGPLTASSYGAMPEDYLRFIEVLAGLVERVRAAKSQKGV